MSISPEEASQAAREQLSGVAAGFGVADPPASPEQAAEDLVAAGGRPAAPDVSELIAAVQAQAAQLAALQQRIDAKQAAEDAAEAAARPPTLSEAIASSSLDSQTAHLFSIIAEHLGI